MDSRTIICEITSLNISRNTKWRHQNKSGQTSISNESKSNKILDFLGVKFLCFELSRKILKKILELWNILEFWLVKYKINQPESNNGITLGSITSLLLRNDVIDIQMGEWEFGRTESGKESRRGANLALSLAIKIDQWEGSIRQNSFQNPLQLDFQSLDVLSLLDCENDYCYCYVVSHYAWVVDCYLLAADWLLDFVHACDYQLHNQPRPTLLYPNTLAYLCDLSSSKIIYKSWVKRGYYVKKQLRNWWYVIDFASAVFYFEFWWAGCGLDIFRQSNTWHKCFEWMDYLSLECPL